MELSIEQSDCGVYVITLPNGYFYIGSSIAMTQRLRQHKCLLLASRHPNAKLQNAFNKHGRDAELHICLYPRDTREAAYQFEQWMLDIAARTSFAAKMCNLAPSAHGHYLSEETKSKLSRAHSGKVLTDEHRRNISLATKGENNPRYGARHSLETRQAISELKRAQNLRGENSWAFGRPRAEETKQKLREHHARKWPSVFLNGHIYPNVRQAAKATSVPRSTIRLWLRTGNPNCRLVKEEV